MSWTSIFTEEELYKMRVRSVTDFLRCETPQAVEASIELAKYINRQGMDSQNYPLVLEILVAGNYHVIDALLEGEDAFDYFAKVEVNAYIVDFALKLLDQYAPGNLYEKVLQIIFGIIYRTYHSPKEGYRIYPLTLEHLNAIGKYLDKTKDQRDSINRFILDILGDIGGFKSINKADPVIDKLAAHAIAIRNAFFDRRLGMEKVIPEKLLVRDDYKKNTVMPRDVVPFKA
ncbi:hypothetical protein WKV44_06280 [Spirochaetia bacterium 38H-sp]|uniref:Uncharacterized protein n=1 Tax=Rarispira pelagica TaxID=3141764 RepID=A0ABU9UBV2_9SPIR